MALKQERAIEMAKELDKMEKSYSLLSKIGEHVKKQLSGKFLGYRKENFGYVGKMKIHNQNYIISVQTEDNYNFAKMFDEGEEVHVKH